MLNVQQRCGHSLAARGSSAVCGMPGSTCCLHRPSACKPAGHSKYPSCSGVPRPVKEATGTVNSGTRTRQPGSCCTGSIPLRVGPSPEHLAALHTSAHPSCLNLSDDLSHVTLHATVVWWCRPLSLLPRVLRAPSLVRSFICV